MLKQKKEKFEFPPSLQSELFNYLKPEQKEFVKPLLRVLKKPAQEELCCMLLDYMEARPFDMGNDQVVGGLFYYMTNNPGIEFKEKPIIRPLSCKTLF